MNGERQKLKWFKHRTDASDGEFISELENKFGLEGYARWFKLLEIVGYRMDETDTCSAAYPWEKWQTLLKGKRKKLETFLEHCRNQSKINLKQNGNILEIEIPNMLKLKDNSTKVLRSIYRQPVNKEVEVEVDKELKTVVNNSKDGNSKPGSTPPVSKGGFKSCLQCGNQMPKHHDECPTCGKSQRLILEERARNGPSPSPVLDGLIDRASSKWSLKRLRKALSE